MELERTLGYFIKNARQLKKYSQKQLAKLTGINFTYLSKIENDKTDHPPTERVIAALARELNLDEEELIFLTGRIPQKDRKFLRENYHEMLVLFRKFRANPSLLKRILNEFKD